jgi:hypothetical protein
MVNVRRELVGQVYVDHGGVVVVDPLYADLSDTDRDALVDPAPDAGAGAQLDCGEENLPGSGHVGVFIPTGLGDGEYPVYAELIDVPGAGERVARIVIDCLGVEDESGDLRERLSGAVGAMRAQTAGGWDVRLPYDDREVLGEPT